MIFSLLPMSIMTLLYGVSDCIKQLLTEVNIDEYSPRQSQGEFLAILTWLEVKNCFSIIIE